MSIKVQSADGVVHEFPDGTAQTVIDQAMKSYALNGATRAPGGQPQPVPGPGMGATAEAVGKAVRGAGAKAPLTGTQNAAGWGRAVQNGLMLGFGDEASAGLQATLDWIGGGLGLSDETGGWSKAYDQRLAQGRALDQQFATENPVMAQVGEGAGGAASALMAPARLAMAQGGGIGAQMLRGGVTGAGAGAVYGFGSGEGGLENRMASAGEGAAAGAAFGAAVPPILGLTGSLARLGRRALQAANPQEAASQKVLEAFQRDKVGLADALQEYARRQQQGMAPEMLMNLGGKNVQDLARASAAVPGEGKNVAMQRLTEQIANEPNVLAGYLGKALGTDNYGGTIDQLVTGRMAASKPLYDQATQSQVVVDVRPILQWVSTQAENAVGPQAVALKRVAGYLLDANGQPKTTIAQLDAVKKALDADYMNAGTDSAIGRGARSLILEAKNELVALMDAAEPAYAKARAAWAGPSESLQAIEVGRNLLTMPEAELRAAVAKLGPGELQFLRLGLRQGLEEQANKIGDTANLTERLFNKRGVPERLALAFDDPRQLQAFLDQVQQLRKVGREARATLPTTGSQTALRDIDQGDLAADPYLRLGADVVEQGPVGALVNAGARLFQTPKGFKEKTAGALVDTLVNQVDPQLIEALLQMQKRAQAKQLRSRQMNLGVIGAGVPVLNED